MLQVICTASFYLLPRTDWGRIRWRWWLRMIHGCLHIFMCNKSLSFFWTRSVCWEWDIVCYLMYYDLRSVSSVTVTEEATTWWQHDDQKYDTSPEVPLTVDIATALIITAAILIHITEIPFTIICMCNVTKDNNLYKTKKFSAIP